MNPLFKCLLDFMGIRAASIHPSSPVPLGSGQDICCKTQYGSFPPAGIIIKGVICTQVFRRELLCPEGLWRPCEGWWSVLCLPGWPVWGQWPCPVSLLIPGPKGSGLSLPPLQIRTMVSLYCSPGKWHWDRFFYDACSKTLITTTNAFIFYF